MTSSSTFFNLHEEDASQKESNEPRRSFAQLLKDKFDRTISVHPKDVNNIFSVSQIREENVRSMMKSIRDCGWKRSSLYASDRGEGKPPILIEGIHRAEALRRLLSREETTWLPRGKTSHNFKIDISVLKNLTLDEEACIACESSKIDTAGVPLTLVDQVLAMHRALKCCRLRQNLPYNAEISFEVLCQAQPDYRRYHSSTIRSWKRMADALSHQSLEFLREKQLEFKAAFSKKTIQESSMLTTLKRYPGVQLWYLKRLLYLEAQENAKPFKAAYFKKMAARLERFANAILDFAACLEHIFDLQNIANAFRDMVNWGKPRRVPQGKMSEQILMSFSHNYLWSSKKDDEVQAALQEREKDTLLFPRIFYQIVAQIHFEDDYEKADEMFEALPNGLRPRFKSHSQILQKRSLSAADSKSKIQKKKKRYPLRSAHKPSKKFHKGSPPDVEQEVAEPESQIQLPGEYFSEHIQPRNPPETLKRTRMELEITYSESNTLPSEVSKSLKKALAVLHYSPREKATLFLPQNGEGTAIFSFPNKEAPF